MKKMITILLALTLLLALAACGETAPAPASAAGTEAPAPAEVPAPETGAPETPAPEPETAAPAEEEGPEPEDDVTGVWYGQIEGVDLRLELQADGVYSLNLPAAPEESLTGVWRLEDGFVWLDDSDEPLAVMGDSLYWYSVGAFVSREEPAPIYKPAPLVESVPLGTIDGYWVAAFLEVDGQVFSAEMLGEDLDLYVEGQRAALGGLFGDRIVDLEENDGALRFAGEGFCADLALQADGFMRLTLSGDFEGELCYYLLPVLLNNAEVEED